MHHATRLIGILQQFSLPLIAGVIAGLAAANIDQHFYDRLIEYHVFGESVKIFGREVVTHYLINEIFMVFFFGVAAKEITHSLLPGGALNPIPKAINPLMGTLGGVFGPVGVYFLLTWIFFGGTDSYSDVANGWGIPTATDIALAWLVARLVFGNGHPAVDFLLLLAVADDAISLGIIAVFYPDSAHPVQPVWLLLTMAGVLTAYGMRRRGFSHWPVYILVAGGLSWTGLSKSGIEPALALVVIVPFLPGPSLYPDVTTPAAAGNQPEGNQIEGPEPRGAAPHSRRESPLDRFEHQVKLPVDLGLFFFAFANAGVAFGSINSVTFIVLLSLIVGKTVGISAFSLVAAKMGFPLPTGMRFKHLAVAGLVAGLGLTVALFVTQKAFTDPTFQDPAKMGAVLSAGVAVLALAAGRILKAKEGIEEGS